MKIAWQFTAWNAFTKKTRPVGHGLSWSTDRFAIQGWATFLPTLITPFPTGRVRFLASPGSKPPGYDHWSLRDKKLSRDLSTKLTPHQ